MAYSYKRHANTARIQALSDLLRTVKDIKEPSWAEKEAIKMDNDMKVAAHKSELALEEREVALEKEYKKLDVMTENQLTKGAFMESVLEKDPLYKSERHSWWRSQEWRRTRKKRIAESKGAGIGRLWGGDGNYFKDRNYKKLRQKDYASILPDLVGVDGTGGRIADIRAMVTTTTSLNRLSGGVIQSNPAAVKTLKSLYNQFYTQAYQNDIMNYANGKQKEDYFRGLSEMHGMFEAMKIEIPTWDVLDTYSTRTANPSSY